MFNSRFLGFSALFLLLFMSLCVRPVRAATVPVVNPPTPALVTPSAWPVGQVGTSPTWAYNVTTAANGAPVTVQPQVTVTSPWQPAAVPSGTSVSVPVPQTYSVPSSPSAAPVPAIPSTPSAPVVRTVNAGAGGAGSTASTMMKASVGVGAGVAVVAALKFVPYLGQAITVGQVGFLIYDALKKDGVSVNAQGQPQRLVSSGFVAQSGALTTNTAHVYADPASACLGEGWNGSMNVTSTGALCTWAGRYYGANAWAAPATQSVMSDAEISAAIDRATAFSPAHAADAINFGLSQGVPLPDGLPITNSVPSLQLSGLPDLTSRSTDSLGNVTNNYTQPTANIELPTVTGQNPKISTGSITTTTINNSTTNTITNFTPPVVVPAISPAGTSGNLPKPNDLCVDHPDILACSNDANVGDVASAVLANKDINISITPVALATAMCPAPITFMNSFGRLESWDIFGIACRQLSMYKPLIIAFAWLAAGLILFGGRVSHE